MSGMMRRLTTIAALALAASAVTASTGAAATPGRTGILGAVPHTRRAAAPVHNLMSSAAVRAAIPTTLSFDSSYETLINRYFADVAAGSTAHATDNVYSVATQYSKIAYQSTFGGSVVDHDPLPANGCNDGADAYCLTDVQLQQEIQAVMAAEGWHGDPASDPTHIFFLITPQGVGSCEDAVDDLCSSNTFCAYHSAFVDSSGENVVYADEPYLGEAAGCAGPEQGFPDDRDADTTINTISHEHNEAITDPFGNAWYSNDGNEDEEADLCAFGFGTQSGGFNQTINGHHYELQQEYSNQDVGCVQRLGGTATPPPPNDGSGPVFDHGGPVIQTNTTYAIYWLPTSANTSPPAVTGTAAVNHTLRSSSGVWSDGPSSYSFQWQRCSAGGTGCTSIPGATAAKYKLKAADAHHVLRSAVTATNVNGPSPAVISHFTARVIGSPVATKPPHISGKTKVGKGLTASKGSWTGRPKTYRFQWLRCNSRGASCRPIRHATKPRYRLASKDARHRLRVRITASNSAGKKSALSRTTRRVAAKR
jgi:hypothetical protein